MIAIKFVEIYLRCWYIIDRFIGHEFNVLDYL